MKTELGNIIKPDSLTDAPNPYPADVGVCTNCGRNPNPAYIPIPIISATRFAAQTVRIRIIFMSMSGFADRASATIHTTRKIAAVTSNPTTSGEVQPHLGA